MDRKEKILIIVEGERAEADFFKQLSTVFGVRFQICCFKANIYCLYQRMKELDFNAEVKDVLREARPELSELDENYAYTYLVFDLDPHHTNRNETRSLLQIVKDNCGKAVEMSEYFNNESDPTVGKLYINYPMMESYRACNCVFDPDYRNEYVKIEEITRFKKYVNSKKLSGKHLKDYTREDFSALMRMNVYKLALLRKNQWQPVSYSEYCNLSESSALLDMQTSLIEAEEKIAVLNTSLFLLLDYYGNQNGFYEQITAGLLPVLLIQMEDRTIGV